MTTWAVGGAKRMQESSIKKRKPSQLLSQAQQNNIRVGPLSESSGSLSVTSLGTSLTRMGTLSWRSS